MIFKRTVINKHIRDPRYPELCPDEMVCVKPVIEHSNICFMVDVGLFTGSSPDLWFQTVFWELPVYLWPETTLQWMFAIMEVSEC